MSATRLARMRHERDVLEERLSGLERLINGDEFPRLELIERVLLRQQRDAMRTYLGVLNARIALTKNRLAHGERRPATPPDPR